MEIIPAILPRDFSEIVEKIDLIKGIASFVQIDICDGKFVKSNTWPYRKQDDNFERILKEEIGMPEWESMNYEFDLMIQNPNEDDARKWLSAGAERLVLHYESSDDLNPVISVLENLVEIGIAINTSTDINEIKKYSDKVQFIQCMGIRKIGYQGQDFDSDIINKIKDIKIQFPNHKVSVDGGVSLENAHLLKHIGVDRLIVGSAIFDNTNSLENIVDTYRKFLNI